MERELGSVAGRGSRGLWLVGRELGSVAGGGSWGRWLGEGAGVGVFNP